MSKKKNVNCQIVKLIMCEGIYKDVPELWKPFVEDRWFPYVYAVMYHPDNGWIMKLLGVYDFCLIRNWDALGICFLQWLRHADDNENIGDYINGPQDARFYFEYMMNDLMSPSQPLSPNPFPRSGQGE